MKNVVLSLQVRNEIRKEYIKITNIRMFLAEPILFLTASLISYKFGRIIHM